MEYSVKCTRILVVQINHMSQASIGQHLELSPFKLLLDLIGDHCDKILVAYERQGQCSGILAIVIEHMNICPGGNQCLQDRCWNAKVITCRQKWSSANILPGG